MDFKNLTNSIYETTVDFLFPKDKELRWLESLSVGEIVENFEKADETPIENAKAIFKYRNPIIRKAVWEIKYRGNKKLAGIFGEIIGEEIINDFSDLLPIGQSKIPVIIPVPISNKRRRSRGFNQCELICEKIIEKFGEINFEYEKNIIIKKEETKHQSESKTKTERLANLKDSFAITPEAESLKGRVVIIIDDVITTGATIKEVAKELRKTGAKKIFAYAIAH